MVSKISIKDYDKFEDFAWDALKHLENAGEDTPMKIAEEIGAKCHPNVQRMIKSQVMTFKGSNRDMLLNICYLQNEEEKIREKSFQYRMETKNNQKCNKSNYSNGRDYGFRGFGLSTERANFNNRNGNNYKYRSSSNNSQNFNNSNRSQLQSSPIEIDRRNKSILECFHCGRRGHKRIDCYLKDLSSEEAKQRQNRSLNNSGFERRDQDYQNPNESQTAPNKSYKREQNHNNYRFNNTSHVNTSQGVNTFDSSSEDLNATGVLKRAGTWPEST